MNVSDFMLESLPLCTDLFEMCYWNGERKNCCEIFSLQRTEEGFCYSFNSLTAETKKECYIRDFFMQSLLLNDQNPACTPRQTTSSGRYSGLTVVLKKDDQLLLNGFSRGINVLISPTYELPEAGSGVVLKRKSGRMLEIEVTPIIIECSSKLISYSSAKRECVLPQEKALKFNNFYSQTNCLIECRHNFISKNCNCQPYFFNDVTSGLPECNLEKLNCLANLSAEIRVMADLVYSNRILNMRNNTDCSCPVPCYGTMYNSLIKRSNLSVFDGEIQHGLLDVHFSNLGAVNYLRKISFSQQELIVSIGGTGNLFLGCSVISLMELVYYFFRGCVTILTRCLRKYRQRLIQPTRFGFYN
ncbi:pickpocket protein 19-like [Cimex lectularius]|uniref:Pickpocket n=1 Tax=Cimex lectularius TaxID=79782 RepID=A0A8I6SVF1_CIMLE|nr:pickpocket protein 19-like [Cimex lectularius]